MSEGAFTVGEWGSTFKLIDGRWHRNGTPVSDEENATIRAAMGSGCIEFWGKWAHGMVHRGPTFELRDGEWLRDGAKVSAGAMVEEVSRGPFRAGVRPCRREFGHFPGEADEIVWSESCNKSGHTHPLCRWKDVGTRG